MTLCGFLGVFFRRVISKRGQHNQRSAYRSDDLRRQGEVLTSSVVEDARHRGCLSLFRVALKLFRWVELPTSSFDLRVAVAASTASK